MLLFPARAYALSIGLLELELESLPMGLAAHFISLAH